jgi:predicted DNA-binding protein (UPF0251 family)
MIDLDEVKITLEELESIRLCNLEDLNQEKAANRMKISQPTFHRLIKEARKKITEALVHGKSLRIEGGVHYISEKSGGER